MFTAFFVNMCNSAYNKSMHRGKHLKRIYWLSVLLIIAGICAAAYLIIQEQQTEIISSGSTKTTEIGPVKINNVSKITINQTATLASLVRSPSKTVVKDGKTYCWTDVSNLSTDNRIRAYAFANYCPSAPNTGITETELTPYAATQLLGATTGNPSVRNITKTSLYNGEAEIVCYTYTMGATNPVNKEKEWVQSAAIVEVPKEYVKNEQIFLVLVHGGAEQDKNASTRLSYNEFQGIVKSLTIAK